MSVREQINRISAAKTDIRDAIQEKGVEVPESTMLDGMAQYIAQISSESPVDKLAGKSVLCAGDSLMRGNGWLGGFKNCLAEAHPNTTIDNIAVSGASLCESDSNPNIFDQLAAKVSTPYDILLLTGGGNDLISGLTVGEPNLTKNGTAGDWLTTCNALDTDLYRVHDYWPECKIFFITLPLVVPGAAGSIPDFQGQLEFWDKIKTVCRRYAVPIIDLTQNGNFVYFIQNQRDKYLYDSLHFNEEGYRFVAPYVESVIMSQL